MPGLMRRRTNQYFVTFRLEENETYKHRYGDLMDFLQDTSNGTYWDEPTSFVLFDSTDELQHIVSGLKRCIDNETDIVVLGIVARGKLMPIGAKESVAAFNYIAS